MSQAEINVEKLVYGGDGLARLDSGEVIFVPLSAPGDRVQVDVQKQSKKRLVGTIEQIVQPAPIRTTPPCSVFGECGGCQWQHLTLEAQRQWKSRIVQESLERIGKLKEVPLAPIIPIDRLDGGLYYRNKAEWEIQPQGDGWALGYHKLRSHDVLAFEKCHIIPPMFTQLYHTLQQANLEGLSRVQVLGNQAGEMLLTLFGTDQPALSVGPLVEEFPNLKGIVVMHQGKLIPLHGQTFLEETLAGRQYIMSPDSFFQVNPAVAELMIGVLESLLPEQFDSLIDIYAGGCFFSIALAKRFKKGIAVESFPGAVANARENLEQNRIKHIECLTGPADVVLSNLELPITAAIIDPPRNGCQPEVLEWVTQNVQSHCIYVSCNPATLARDLAWMVDQGWHLSKVHPLDMFPQTYHVEAVALLTRNT